VIGRVGGDALEISIDGDKTIDSSIADLEPPWQNSLEKQLNDIERSNGQTTRTV
jgi:hypothetical protein